MTTTRILQLDYLSHEQLHAQSSDWWETVLGVVGFDKLPVVGDGQVPITASMTPTLGTSGDVCEVWRVAGPRIPLLNGDAPQSRVRYRYCDDLMFGYITIDEAGGHGGGGSMALLQATEAAYREIFAVLRDSEHRHLIRIWNYLPDINGDADGDERYRHFNSARKMAFRNSGRTTVDSVPAACALGSPAGSPISIYFLASRHAPTMIENPRQTSAYHYPQKYGAHSPIFSRACVMGDSAGTTLFVSGTASIVGHETVHRGDVAAQTHETVANIDALLKEANRVVGTSRYSLDALKYKVYVRQPGDLDVIEDVLSGALNTASVVYLQADVCREDLLVEIEATGE
jgi:chorismate lyase / 3-hydroxybenzoate synthase